MATLRITIRGTLGQISASSFEAVLHHSLRILRDLDRRISEERRGTLQWVVSGLGEGSGFLDLTTRVIRGDTDYAPKVHGTFTTGVDTIQREGVTPPYFSYEDMAAIRDIVREVGRDGLEGVHYRSDQAASTLSQDAEAELDKLVGIRYRAYGAIEGHVELVSVKRRARRFDVTHHRTLKAIRCNLPEQLEDSVFQAIKERRRVVVSGLIGYNAKNEPVRVQVKKPIRFLGRPEDLPTSTDIAGSDGDLTGAVSTEDFVRSLRDG